MTRGSILAVALGAIVLGSATLWLVGGGPGPGRGVHKDAPQPDRAKDEEEADLVPADPRSTDSQGRAAVTTASGARDVGGASGSGPGKTGEPAPEPAPVGLGISGVVQLADGYPVAGATVSAVATNRPSDGSEYDEPGLWSASAQADPEGHFVIDGLVQESYELHVAKTSFLDAVSGQLAQAGDENVELVVDAVLLRVRCDSETGFPVPMKLLASTVLGTPEDPYAEPAGFISQWSSKLFDTPTVYELWTAPKQRRAISALGADGLAYYGLVQPNLASGQYDVPLTRRVAGLGTIEVILDRSRLPESASFDITGCTIRDLDASTSVQMRTLDGTREVIEIGALLPGPYDLGWELSGADPLVLVSSGGTCEVEADKASQVVAEWVEGGSLLVRVTGPRLGEDVQRATVAVESQTNGFGKRLDLTGGSEEDLNDDHAVTVGGPARGTELFPPGDYVVTVRCDGFEPASSKVSVRSGEQVPLSVDLIPESEPLTPR